MRHLKNKGIKMNKVKMTGLVILAVLGLSACGSGGGDSSDQTSKFEGHPFEAPMIAENVKNEYLNAINAVRASARTCGQTQYPSAPPLSWDDGLYRASYEHSYDVATSGYFSHTGSGTSSDWTSNVLSLGRGSSPQERIDNNMGRTFYPHYGENVTMGNSVSASIANFLSSTPHCAEMMNKDAEFIGIANMNGVWTQTFLRKNKL